MSENKQVSNNTDAKSEEKVDKKPTGKEAAKEEAAEKQETGSYLNNKTDGPEDLPEDIRKKLEQRKEKRKSEKKAAKGKTKKRKKSAPQKVSVGKAYIKATYNNTIVTLTDLNGNVISWASAGVAGFKGPKKSTPYAAQIITRIAVEKAKEAGLQEVSVYVNGVGTGRESAVRALNANGLMVSYIKDVTPIPHNGCRKRKPRRV
jgi:small subunit ribosomal protein S11